MGVVAFVDEGLGHSSYVVDLGTGTAAMIDPPPFPIAQEALIERSGWRLGWTVDTHSHADYVTGSPGLVARRGVTFVAPAASDLATPHHGVTDGDRVELAPGLTLVAIATPGHTPDHHAFLLEANRRPMALFTGGSLMTGTVGRTDLCGPALAVPLARDMFRSLRRFDHLPDALPIYPTHGAGSFCSALGSVERTSTLGRERATNPLFRLADETSFVEQLLGGFGTFPTYFERLPELNRRGPTPIASLPNLPRLDADAVTRLQAEGAAVVDARPFTAFATGHVPGSLSNALRPVFGSWLGWLVDLDTPLVFVLDEDQDRAELVRQCLDVGHELLLGELDGGIGEWSAGERPLAEIAVVDAERIDPVVIDVRQAVEYRTGHVPGARNVELGAIATATFDPDVPMTVMCGHGERAMTAASVLSARGHIVRVFRGGPDTWSASTGRALDSR